MKTTRGGEFRFPEPGLLFKLTCVNHPDGQWLTKGPSRNLHWVGWGEDGFKRHPEFGINECDCPYGDLRVVVDENGEPV